MDIASDITHDHFYDWLYFRFPVKIIFNGSARGNTIIILWKIAIFDTLRRLDTTWNFAHSITWVSIRELDWDHCLCTQSLLKRKFLNNSRYQLFFSSLMREVSISKCDITWRRVKVERYNLPATAIHARSHVTFPAFYFSIVCYMRLLFQLKGQYYDKWQNNKLSVRLFWTKL